MQARENLRQAYLDAMGIQTWFPRQALPNAQPARAFDWLMYENQDATSVDDSNDGEATIESSTPDYSVAASAKQLRPSDILKSVSPENIAINEPVPVPVHKPDITQSVITISKFRLVITPLGSDNLVVAEMPYTGLSQFTRYHHRLLQDLARAFRLPLPSDELIKEFSWPLSSAASHHGLFRQMSQDDQAATDAVSAFLANQFNLPKKKIILLLGQAAAHFVLDQSRPFDELRGIHQHSSTGQTYAVTHGLNELMKIPKLKPETWQDLQALIPA